VTIDLIRQHKLSHFFGEDDKTTFPLTLWFDSAKEGKDFANLLMRNRDHFTCAGANLGNILDSSLKYVKHKTDYRKGVYWPLVDIHKMRVLDSKIIAPHSITELSQWQHHDFVIAKNQDPMFAVEVTEHILTWNNVAQRLPRMVLSASNTVPSAILQKFNEKTTDKHKGWFLQAFSKSSEIFKTPCVALMFKEDNREDQAKVLSDLSCDLLEYICYDSTEALKRMNEHLWSIAEDNQKVANKLYAANPLLPCKWLTITPEEVRVFIGVRPEDSMWNTKGTGGLDPYPGLVLLADMLLCRTGPKRTDRSRKLVVEFKNLKRDFWWFAKYPDELYLQLLIDKDKRIADEVVFKRGSA